MSLYLSNQPEIRFQVSHSDGSIPNRPLGHYWRMEVGAGHFGDEHGPFSTEDEAKANAVSYIDERVAGHAKRLRDDFRKRFPQTAAMWKKS